MTLLMQLRVALAVIGVIVWGYGVAQDESRVRLVGIVVLLFALLLRFTPKRFQREDDGNTTM